MVSALFVVCLSLLVVAALMLVKSGVFDVRSTIDAEQSTAVWAFLGAGLGAVVTAGVGLAAHARERADLRLRQHAELRQAADSAAAKAEAQRVAERLDLETRIRVLELLTEGDDYAPQARVGGALTMLAAPGQSPMMVRLLWDLWPGEHVSSATAVWLLDQVLRDASGDGTKLEAASVLSLNADQLVAKEDWDGPFYLDWPPLLRGDRWPTGLALTVQLALLQACLEVLKHRSVAFWQRHSGCFALDNVVLAATQADPEVRGLAAQVLLCLEREADGDGELELHALLSDYACGVFDSWRSRPTAQRDAMEMPLPRDARAEILAVQKWCLDGPASHTERPAVRRGHLTGVRRSSRAASSRRT